MPRFRPHLLTDLRLQKPLLALVVLLLGVANLASTAHFALVAHQRCAEHGELTHAHETHTHATQAGVTAAENADDRHDHCGAASVLRERVTPPQPPQLVEMLDLVLVQKLQPPLLNALLPLPVSLRDAPKTSPPMPRIFA